jgi:hypothetical protein
VARLDGLRARIDEAAVSARKVTIEALVEIANERTVAEQSAEAFAEGGRAYRERPGTRPHAPG